MFFFRRLSVSRISHTHAVLPLAFAWLAFAMLTLAWPHPLRAQLTGTVSMGGQATNNVQSLDTIAPDQILMPAFELNYDVHPSGVSMVSLTSSYTPNFYNLNPGLSFQEISIGATGIFYLSNQDAITAEEMEAGGESSAKPSHASHFMRWGREDAYPDFEPAPIPMSPHVAQESKNDSLVDLAVSALYTLSGQLDSAEISSKGITKSRVSELEDLRDSVSDVVSTVADLLDSAGYSESASEIVVGELEHLRTPLESIMPHTATANVQPSLLDAAIRLLGEARPEEDFLPTAPTPSAPATASPQQKKLIQSLSVISIPGEKATTDAPTLTLITTSTRLREFGYSDAEVHDDVDDSGAKTMATALTMPVAYTNHFGVHYSPADSILFGGNFGGNPNDNKMFTFGAAVEGLTSTSFSLRGSYDYTHDAFPFDSVYSNTENRLTFTPRFEAGRSTVLFGEAAVGLRKYLTPLIETVSPATYDTVHRLKKGDTIITTKKAVIDTAGSSFDQFSYGAGVAQWIGENWIVGALVAFNDNPNLRGYVTTGDLTLGAKAKTVRAAAQIADDEYTYNLGRYTLYTDARVWGGVDLGMDLSYEHRKYGAALGPKGGILDSSRIENGEFFNASISKLFPFEQRWIGMFTGLLLEGKLELDSVVSTQSIYSYALTAFTFTATLTF